MIFEKSPDNYIDTEGFFYYNYVYAYPYQYEFVWNYLTSHCPKAKIKRSQK